MCNKQPLQKTEIFYYMVSQSVEDYQLMIVQCHIFINESSLKISSCVNNCAS